MIYPARQFLLTEGLMKERRSDLIILTECSIMIALGTVLSVLKLFELPYGGSITLASMLPVAIIAYRHGIKYGAVTAFSVSLIQMLLGLKNFSYFTTWESFVALAIFDYVAAFGVFALAGVFKGKIKKQSAAISAGILLCCLLRYLCHVISGATIWAGLSIPTDAALVYSLSYNATYMIPDTIILVACGAYVCSALDITGKNLTRIRTDKVSGGRLWCLIGSGASALAAIITDTVLIFSKLQNAESGEFDITAIAQVNWIAIAIVTAVCAAISIALFIISNKISENK